MRAAYKILTGKPDGKVHLEDTDIDVKVIKYILKIYFGRWGTGII
jgi:hypothetical protein